MVRSWAVILDGARAARATDAAEAVLRCLRELPEAQMGETWNAAGGSAGVAVALSHAAALLGDDALRADADAVLDLSLAGLAESRWADADLYGGPLGVGWALDSIERLAHGGGLDPDELDDDRDDDVLAARLLEGDPWPGVHDLTRGLVGVGIHALEALPRGGAHERLERVVEHLAATAIEDGSGGVLWRTPPTVLPGENAARFPDGYVDLGVAHGQLGVVGLLAAAAEAGVAGARALVEPVLDHVLRQRRSGAGGRYPSMISKDGPAPGTRLAWCYGDVGTAACMALAARSLDDDELRSEAHATLQSALDLPLEQSYVVDAGLCHGAVGVAHCLAVAGSELGDERALERAASWADAALTLRADGFDEVAGFFAMLREPGDPAAEARPSTGFLEGAAGIAVGLLNLTSDRIPAWDRFLLPSCPPT